MSNGCTIAVAEQMGDFLKLEDGWCDGAGSSYDSDDVMRVQRIVETLVARGVPIPFIYPMPEGGYSLEWDVFDSESVAICIDRDVATARLVGFGAGAREIHASDTDALFERLQPLMTC